jgi:hypothetical protein
MKEKKLRPFNVERDACLEARSREEILEIESHDYRTDSGRFGIGEYIYISGYRNNLGSKHIRFCGS